MAGSTDAVPAASSNGAVACLAPIATAAPPKLMGKSKIASLTCLGSAISCASLVVSVYLLPFWTDVIGVGPQFMGIVIICAKVAEAVSVVSAGIFSDSCMIRFGRRRPFLIFCIPAAVLYALLFNPPQDVVSSGGAASAWVLTVGIAFYGVWPYLTVCHSSWCAEYCRDYVERNVLYGFRFFFGTIGTITGAVLPLIVAAACGLSEQVLDEKIRINHYVGISVAVIIAVVSLLVLAFVSENSRQNSDSSVWKALVSWVLQAFGAIRHSRTVRVHMLMSFLYDIALAYAVSFLPYMTSRVHKLRTTLVLGSYVVMSLICIPVWLKVSQYYEKNHVLSAACASQSGFMMAAGLVIYSYDLPLLPNT
jgi:GPH family glycoside/pentoside/hexuronide:cation symporter